MTTLTNDPIVSALRDLPNIAQFVKCCAINKLISGSARLVKRAIDLMRLQVSKTIRIRKRRPVK